MTAPSLSISAENETQGHMNLPMWLTVLRIFFVPLVVVLLLTKGRDLDLFAAGVFLLAAITDLFDGYLARKRKQVTPLGVLLDPLADKLLTASAFISLVALGLVPAWMVVILVGRDLAVSGLRSVASAEGFALQASDLGKTKMVLQVSAITVIILVHRYARLRELGTVLLWLAVILAVASAGQYFTNFLRTLSRRRARHDSASSLVVLPGGKDVAEGDEDQAAR